MGKPPQPLPLMTAIQVETLLVPEMAVFHAKEGMHDPLVVMFTHLKDQYGWHMFQKAFSAAIADGINWDHLGANPSALRTAYVAAYLQIGTQRTSRKSWPGKCPATTRQWWRDILRRREKWASLPPDSEHRPPSGRPT